MDASIGKLLAELEDQGILDETIVIFFSDNGGGGGSDNSPLRGGKARMWEGGISVPCLVRWPAGGIPAGEVNDAFLSSLEIFPSLAAAAGVELPEDVVLDGYNWWPVLRGQRPSPRTEMFWQRRDHIGARVGRWKWVEMGSRAGGLYDLQADVGESEDLSQRRPEMLEKVRQRYKAWVAEMEAAAPRGPFRDF
jgi:arylsulfatase A-like enzyme